LRPSDSSLSSKVPSALAVAIFLLLAGALGHHVYSTLALPGLEEEGRAGLLDFRDQAYYPARSVLDGNNPYDAEAQVRLYPVAKLFSPYSPSMLALFIPFAVLPLWLAQVLYYVANLGLVLALAWISLRLSGWTASTTQTFAVGTLILLSRPGEWNAALGQFGALGATATCAALAAGRSKPELAGAALAVSMFKMTYGVPLAVLMLARGGWRGVGYGLIVTGLMSAPVVGALVLSAGSLEAFLAEAREGYTAWRVGYGDAAEVPLRVDAPAVIARILGHGIGTVGELIVAAALLMLGIVLVRRLARSTEADNARSVEAGIASLVILLAFYHQPYDLLLLVLPLTVLSAAISRSGGVRHARVHALLFVLLLVPMANYFLFGVPAALLGLAGPWRVAAASLNGAAVLLALLIWSVVVLRRTG
jgi:hypothetical protein